MKPRSILQWISLIGILSIITSCTDPSSQNITVEPEKIVQQTITAVSEKENKTSSMKDLMNNVDTVSCDSKNTQELKDQCLDNVALTKAKANNDVLICTSIKDKNTLGICLAETKKDECIGIINSEVKNACMSTRQIKEAISSMDIALCEKIQDDEQRKSCKSTIIFSDAVNKKDPEICLNLADIDQQNSCKDTIK